MKRILGLFFLAVFALCAAFPAHAGVKAVIDKSDQRMQVWVDGTLAYTWPCSTGLVGTYTPTGTFHPQSLVPHQVSFKYHNEPMAWVVYYQGNRGIHGTDGVFDAKLGQPASMGCTHITNAEAEIFYGLAGKYGSRNVTIVIQE